MPEITVDQWLAELDRLGVGRGRDDRGYTVLEMVQIMDKSKAWVMQRLVHPAINAGMLKQGWRTTRRVDGRRQDVPVYRIVENHATGS